MTAYTTRRVPTLARFTSRMTGVALRSVRVWIEAEAASASSWLNASKPSVRLAR
jgi:hypothetical protein